MEIMATGCYPRVVFHRSIRKLIVKYDEFNFDYGFFSSQYFKRRLMPNIVLLNHVQFAITEIQTSHRTILISRQMSKIKKWNGEIPSTHTVDI